MRTGSVVPRSKGSNNYRGKPTESGVRVRPGKIPGSGARLRSVKTPGSGVRLRPGKALLWLFALLVGLGFVILLSLALLFGFRWLTTNSFFSLSEIEITGNSRLSTEELVALAGVDLGMNTLEMRIRDVEDRVVANPWTDQVAVRRVLPGKLSIAVTERIPAYWLRTGKGLFYTEADGSVIDAVSPGRFVSFPLLEVGADAGLDELALRMADFDEAGLPVRAGQAAWIRLLGERLEMYFEERDLWLSVSAKEWKRNMECLSLVWGDLERRGEAGGAREIRIFGGKVWVRT
ncbi:MAG: FtsQ-type POTRA domain-containing protein [Proteobacteria bacterium]|nr:FtsQ-type POTRA domain-containing protein [Pseudomonadota bacterium]